MSDVRSILDIYSLNPNIVAAERVEKDARADRIKVIKEIQRLCHHGDIAKTRWNGHREKWVCLKCGVFAEDWGTPLMFRTSEKPFEISDQEFNKRMRFSDR